MSLTQGQISVFRLGLFSALVVISYLVVTPLDYPAAQEVNDKVAHIGAFIVLAFLADYAFPRQGFGRAKIVALLAYGLLIEVVQHFLPYREFSLYDWLADAAGVLAYGLALPVLTRVPLLGRG